MKKLLMLLLFVSTICSAQAPAEAVQNVQLCVIKPGNEDSVIIIDRKAVAYIDHLSEAVDNPGKSILMKESREVVRFKLFFKRIEKVRREWIVYDDSKKVINLIKSSKEEETQSYMLLFGVASLVLMMVSNIFFKKKKLVASSCFAVASFVFTLVLFTVFPKVAIHTPLTTITFLAVTTGLFANISAIFVIVLAIIAGINSSPLCEKGTNCDPPFEKKGYNFFSIRYFILLVAYLILLFI